jgi:hypothetical protein
MWPATESGGNGGGWSPYPSMFTAQATGTAATAAAAMTVSKLMPTTNIGGGRRPNREKESDAMKTLLVGAVFAVGVGIAGVAAAAPAMAQPVTFGCAPCVSVPVEDPDNPGTFIDTPTPVWDAFFDGTNGVFGDGEGAWETGVQAVNGGAQESIADATDGVPGDGEGAWEKVFPPAG